MTTLTQATDYLEEISNFIFVSKYAKYLESEKRRETPEETANRLEAMHLKRYRSKLNKEQIKKVRWAFDMVRAKKVLPSMRSFQFGGSAIEKHNQRMFNCSVRHIDSIRSFSEVFHLLLCGCGVGIGLSKFFLGRLPDLVDSTDKTGLVITYSVEDTIEGWADSLEALLNCYFRNTPYTGRKIVFDYSRIRKKGAALKSSGGKAPGYKPLKEAHRKIKELLDYTIEELNCKRLRSIDAYDILMHSADAVLSGGIRRSATCVVFDKDDTLMIEAKTSFVVDKVWAFDEIKNGELTEYHGRVTYKGKKVDVILDGSSAKWEYDNLKQNKTIFWSRVEMQRGRSNNSVLLLRDKVTKEEFSAIVERTKMFGEPGFVFADHPWTLFNPCFEISFIPVTEDGRCGVQFCNLTTMNGRLIKSIEDFLLAAEASAIIGTLQAGYTNFRYLNKESQLLTEEEALLGCSITGIMDSPDILLNTSYQKLAAQKVTETNEEWASYIGIKKAARKTCLKPEGTTSLYLGTASGAHGHHAKPRYFRRVVCNKMEPPYKFFKKHNPELCEEYSWNPNKTDDVITFPIEVPMTTISKDDLTAIQHLGIIKDLQENWVEEGSKDSVKPLKHNVSCTISVKNDEWQSVIDFIYENRGRFAALSLLSSSGDKTYRQAPNERVLPEDEERWKRITENFHHVDYLKMIEAADETHLQQEIACAGGQCEIVSL